MTNQEIFDKVATHLLTQNAKSLMPHSIISCAYRGEGGRKCAAGIFIPDDLYTAALEGKSVTFDAVRETMPDITTEQINKFLTRLQTVHDGHEPEEWRGQLLDVAADFELSPNVVTAFPAGA